MAGTGGRQSLVPVLFTRAVYVDHLPTDRHPAGDVLDGWGRLEWLPVGCGLWVWDTRATLSRA